MLKRIQRIIAVLVSVMLLWMDVTAVHGADAWEIREMAEGIIAETTENDLIQETESESSNANVQISAPSAILMEATTGQVIYEKNVGERRSPASVTKVMTMLLAMEDR